LAQEAVVVLVVRTEQEALVQILFFQLLLLLVVAVVVRLVTDLVMVEAKPLQLVALVAVVAQSIAGPQVRELVEPLGKAMQVAMEMQRVLQVVAVAVLLLLVQIQLLMVAMEVLELHHLLLVPL
jgi:hypothetical protein